MWPIKTWILACEARSGALFTLSVRTSRNSFWCGAKVSPPHSLLGWYGGFGGPPPKSRSGIITTTTGYYGKVFRVFYLCFDWSSWMIFDFNGWILLKWYLGSSQRSWFFHSLYRSQYYILNSFFNLAGILYNIMMILVMCKH